MVVTFSQFQSECFTVFNVLSSFSITNLALKSKSIKLFQYKVNQDDKSLNQLIMQN